MSHPFQADARVHAFAVGSILLLTLATPHIGIAMTMIAILSGQVGKSVLIDHFGWFGTARKRVKRQGQPGQQGGNHTPRKADGALTITDELHAHGKTPMQSAYKTEDHSAVVQ